MNTLIFLADALAECDGQMAGEAGQSFVADCISDNRLPANALLDGVRRAIEPQWWRSAEVCFETSSAIFTIEGRKVHAAEIAFDSEAWSRELSNVTLRGFRRLCWEGDPAARQEQETELARHLKSPFAPFFAPEQSDPGRRVAPLISKMKEWKHLPRKLVVGWFKRKKLQLHISIEGELRDEAEPPPFLFWATPAATLVPINGAVPTTDPETGSRIVGIAMVNCDEFDSLAREYLARERLHSIPASGKPERPVAGLLGLAPGERGGVAEGRQAERKRNTKAMYAMYYNIALRNGHNANGSQRSRADIAKAVANDPQAKASATNKAPAWSTVKRRLDEHYAGWAEKSWAKKTGKNSCPL